MDLDLLLNDIQNKIKKFNKETLETIEILKTIPFVKTLILENKLLKQENQILKNKLEIRPPNLNLEISERRVQSICNLMWVTSGLNSSMQGVLSIALLNVVARIDKI